MRDSPRSPMAKTNGSSREGNRIINPHSRIPKKTNKQTNSLHTPDTPTTNYIASLWSFGSFVPFYFITY